MAQRKRAGPITQRSVDRNHSPLYNNYLVFGTKNFYMRGLNFEDVFCIFLYLLSPPIAQFVERRTVDAALTGILRSLVQIRLGGKGPFPLIS